MNSLIPSVPDVLYHLTCAEHGHPGILGTGVLRPGSDGLVWMTDLDTPIRDALGLVRPGVTCDKGAVRYRVDDTTHAVPWLAFRKDLPREVVALLEAVPGAMPRHWFVSWVPMEAKYDPVQSRT